MGGYWFIDFFVAGWGYGGFLYFDVVGFGVWVVIGAGGYWWCGVGDGRVLCYFDVDYVGYCVVGVFLWWGGVVVDRVDRIIESVVDIIIVVGGMGCLSVIILFLDLGVKLMNIM